MTSKTSPSKTNMRIHYRGDLPEIGVTPLELESSALFLGDFISSPVTIFCSTPIERLRAACEAFNAKLNEGEK